MIVIEVAFLVASSKVTGFFEKFPGTNIEMMMYDESDEFDHIFLDKLRVFSQPVSVEPWSENRRGRSCRRSIDDDSKRRGA